MDILSASSSHGTRLVLHPAMRTSHAVFIGVDKCLDGHRRWRLILSSDQAKYHQDFPRAQELMTLTKWTIDH